MTRGVILGLLAAMLIALALRLPELDGRPMHNDEAVNALKFQSLWVNHFYRYDPDEYHGPALAYCTWLWSKLTRAPDFARFDEARLRAVAVLLGLGLVLLLPLVADGLGKGGTVCAGVLTAVSPALVYYSRDYIHEPLLVFFTFLAMASGWRYFRSGKGAWALAAGAAVGLMQSAKETFVLALAAMGVALICTRAWTRWRDGHDAKAEFRFKAGHVLAGLGAWLIVALLFFSSFFTNARGPLDAVRTYLPWFDRATGDSAHLHAWNFYFTRLLYFHVDHGPVWSEGLILGLALAGVFAAFKRNGLPEPQNRFVRFLGFYTVLLTVCYSLVPYKTPWCLLGFWHGTILLAGVGAAFLIQRARSGWVKIAVALVLALGAGQLGVRAWQAAVPLAADRRNPYVYAQTSPDILKLVDEVRALSELDPAGRRMLVKVIAPGNDYWPLPWYLRDFDDVGWWSHVPPDPYAPVMIVSAKLGADLEAGGSHVMVGLFEMRTDAFFELYVDSNLWRARLAARSGQALPPQ